MKKFVGFSVLAVALVIVSQQQASAWENFKFAVGANLNWSSGNNNFGWGLWRNGQVPGAPDTSYHGYGHQGQGYLGHQGNGFNPYYGGGHGPEFIPPATDKKAGPATTTAEPPAPMKEVEAEPVSYRYGVPVAPYSYAPTYYTPQSGYYVDYSYWTNEGR